MTYQEEQSGLIEIVEAALLLRMYWGVDAAKQADSQERLIHAMEKMKILKRKDFCDEEQVSE
jgi:hypothetical protein